MAGSNRYWKLVFGLLIAIIVIGSLIVWAKYSPSQPIEITLPPSQSLPQGEIYISGEVNNPGVYPLKEEDSINDIVQAAGGISGDADINRLELYVTRSGGKETPQKINLNKAEAWLLQALPGIGEVRAKAIINYRQQNGRFRHINELIDVEGIGLTTYDRIKHLITVTE
jgi:competence protein ComEA